MTYLLKAFTVAILCSMPVTQAYLTQGKPVTVSSLLSPNLSSYLTDGLIDINRFAHTLYEANPWMNI